MIKYPEGAIRSFRALKRCRETVFYLTLTEESGYIKFDDCKRDRRNKPFKPRHRGYNFYMEGKVVANLWAPTNEFAFNLWTDKDSVPPLDFVFVNYWLAYAHIERNKPRDDQQAGS